MEEKKLELRPYQDVLVTNTLEAILAGNIDILNIAATGAGKTVCMVRFCEELEKTYEHNDITLILSHLSLLTDQTKDKFTKFSDLKVGIMQADIVPFEDSQVVISTMQSAKDFSKILHLITVLGKRVRTIITDESHRRFSASYSTIFDYFKDVPKVDFTATPYWGNKLATSYYDRVAFQISMQDLIDQKYLVPPVLRQIEFESDSTEKRCAITLGTYLKFEKGKGAICFMGNKHECKLLCDSFTNEGIKAKVVTDNVKGAKRQEIFRQYDAGEVDVLITVEVLTAGFDSPRCESVFMFGTDSVINFIQRLGRALRPEDSSSVKPHHEKQTARCYVFGNTPTLQSGEIEKTFKLALKPKSKEDCKTINEVKEWLEENDLKDSPEYYNIKEAVRVQKIANKLNMPLISSMLEDREIDPQFLGNLATGVSGCKSANDKPSSIELRKALIIALINNDNVYIEDYSKINDGEARALYKAVTGREYSSYMGSSEHVFKDGLHKGKHVSQVNWAYKQSVLKNKPWSDAAKIIRSFHKSTSQPK